MKLPGSFWGTLRWTKALNLLMEANLLLDSRNDLMATQFYSKVNQAPRNTYMKQIMLRCLEQDYEIFPNN